MLLTLHRRSKEGRRFKSWFTEWEERMPLWIFSLIFSVVPIETIIYKGHQLMAHARGSPAFPAHRDFDRWKITMIRHIMTSSPDIVIVSCPINAFSFRLRPRRHALPENRCRTRPHRSPGDAP